MNRVINFVHYESTYCEDWDRFVLSNRQGALGHLSSQFVLADENTSSINRSILIYQDSAQLVGILPLYEAKSFALRVIPIRSLASTTGPLFRENLAASEQRNVLDLLLAYVRSLADKLGVDHTSITYPSMIDGQLAVERFGFFPLRKYGYTESNILGTYIDLSRSDSDLMASVKKKCRYEIRRAEKDGVQISPIDKREDWLGCEPLNEQTLGKHKHSKQMMEIVWDEFIVKGHAYALIAKHEDRTLSAVVIQSFHGNAYYWMAFNARPSFPGAHNYLLWHSILHAKKLGLSFFLMGTLNFSEDAKTQGISDFKKSFGGIPYYVLGGTLLRRKIKHHSILLFLEVARRCRGKIMGWTLAFKHNLGWSNVKQPAVDCRRGDSTREAV